jgi:hypothetical protein
MRPASVVQPQAARPSLDRGGIFQPAQGGAGRASFSSVSGQGAASM